MTDEGGGFGRSLGLWRATASAPAMIASTLLLVFLLGWMGAWEGVALLGWLGIGLGMLTRPGERLAMGAHGSRPMTARDRERLRPLFVAALERCGMQPSAVDWYSVCTAQVNAYASGRRSIALTRGLLDSLATGRLTAPMAEAVLVHEIGHLATNATRYAFATHWLATRWRYATRLLLGVAFGLLGRRQPLRLLALVVVAAVTVAIGHAARYGNWSVVIVLTSLAVFALAAPMADAAISRHCERVADRFATRHGAGAELADALARFGAHPPHIGSAAVPLRAIPSVIVGLSCWGSKPTAARHVLRCPSVS